MRKRSDGPPFVEEKGYCAIQTRVKGWVPPVALRGSSEHSQAATVHLARLIPHRGRRETVGATSPIAIGDMSKEEDEAFGCSKHPIAIRTSFFEMPDGEWKSQFL